jgi:membrane associated rhomboid family serine protease
MKKFFYEYGQLNWLYVLFAANVVGFLIAYFTFLISDGTSAFFFAIHSGDSWSLLKVWKLLTYAFTDHSVFGLIGNLMWLWVFGGTLAAVIGSKHIFNLYIVVTILLGILAGILCLFAGEKYPVFLLGFDMVTIAVAAACVYKIPHQKLSFMLVGSIPIWIVGIVFLLFKIFAFPSKAMVLVLLLSFLAGVLGFLYMVAFNKDPNFFEWQGFRNFFNGLFKKKKKNKGKLVAITGNKKQWSNTESQEQLNKILDKISEKGMDGISNDEKKFLENYSKREK